MCLTPAISNVMAVLWWLCSLTEVYINHICRIRSFGGHLEANGASSCIKAWMILLCEICCIRFLVEYLLLCCRYIEVVNYSICIFVWYFYACAYACTGCGLKAVNKESESELYMIYVLLLCVAGIKYHIFNYVHDRSSKLTLVFVLYISLKLGAETKFCRPNFEMHVVTKNSNVILGVQLSNF